MDFGSVYFKLIAASGIVSCALGMIFWKDLWNRGLSAAGPRTPRSGRG